MGCVFACVCLCGARTSTRKTDTKAHTYLAAALEALVDPLLAHGAQVGLALERVLFRLCVCVAAAFGERAVATAVAADSCARCAAARPSSIARTERNPLASPPTLNSAALTLQLTTTCGVVAAEKRVCTMPPASASALATASASSLP